MQIERLETHPCWRLDQRPSVEAHDLAAGAGEAQNHRDRTTTDAVPILIACGASKKADFN